MENLTERKVEERIEKPLEESVESQVEDELEQSLEAYVESPAENEVESLVEEPIEEATAEPRKFYMIFFRVGIILLCTLLTFYFGITVYFMNHFYYGSEINGVNVSMKSVVDVEILMATELQEYSLNLKERGGKSEQIKAIDMGLTYKSEEEFKILKARQNPFSWVLAYFNTKDSKMTADVIYDEKLLKKRIDKLSCFEPSNSIEPQNPSFQYVDNSYVILDEIPGNKVDKELLYAHIADVLLKKEIEIDLEAMSAYIEPLYHSKSQKIIEAKDLLNKYSSSKITYTFGNSEEVLAGDTINKWLTVDENFGVVLEEKKVEDYIDALSEKYNTPGRIRNFATSSGETIKVSGGDFRRPINKAIELQNLISAIKDGLMVTKEPVYGETILSYGNSDIGDTYVEIDLTNQHIWFYKKGSLIVEGAVVTGNVRAGHTTPKGVYSLKYKVKNVVLRGPGYAAPVAFWMPFNGGIGMHDANWRDAFGGNIYKTNGSHGCINCPQNVARAIYNNIEPDTPVICY